jgi:hypothetical protein
MNDEFCPVVDFILVLTGYLTNHIPIFFKHYFPRAGMSCRIKYTKIPGDDADFRETYRNVYKKLTRCGEMIPYRTAGEQPEFFLQIKKAVRGDSF